jgi:hypothetical protein
LVRIKHFILISTTGLILFTISILTVHISFAKFEILPLPYFPTDKRPYIFLNISNRVYENPTIVNLSSNDPNGANVTIYARANAVDKLANPVMGNCNITTTQIGHSNHSIPFDVIKHALLGNNTNVTCSARDQEKNTRIDKFVVVPHDFTPPVFENHTTIALSIPLKTGAFLTVLNYSVGVRDIDESTSSIKTSCNPSPGTFLQTKPYSIEVKCSASDKAHNKNSMSFYVPVQILSYTPISRIMTDIEKENASTGSTIYKICGNQSNIEMNLCNIPALNTRLNSVSQNLSKIKEMIYENSRGGHATFSVFNSKLAFVLTQGATDVKTLSIYGLHNKTQIKIFPSDLLDTTTGNSIQYGNITFSNNKSNETIFLNKGETRKTLVHVHAPEAGSFSGNIILYCLT